VAGMYFLALIMIRMLGKRALGELGPFDFVIMTGVGDEVISAAFDSSILYYEGIFVLATLAVLDEQQYCSISAHCWRIAPLPMTSANNHML